jgi:4'-phosphopantetheinyl transferase
MRADGLRWIETGTLTAWRGDGTMAAAGVFDLRDPALATTVALPPTSRDIADERQPLAGRRDHFRARRALTRHLVANWLGRAAESVVIAHDPAGAARVIAPDDTLFVSVAARGPIAAIAVSLSPVGVDLEPVEPPREPVWNVLHPDERAAVANAWRAGDDNPFRDVWIAKEAWLKALGAGLRRDPAEIVVRLVGDDGFDMSDDGDARRLALGAFHSAVIGAARFRCAVAILATP